VLGTSLAHAYQTSASATFDVVDAATIRRAAATLRKKRFVDRKVALDLLPRVLDVDAARRLYSGVESLATKVATLERVANGNDLSFAYAALRRGYDARLADKASRALHFADKIVELAPRGLESVSVPAVLLRLVARANQAAALNDDDDESDDACLLGGTTDFAREIKCRAEGRPPSSSTKNFWSSMFFASSSRRQESNGNTLQAELSDIRVGDARPSTPAEWRCVERRLVLRGCVVRMRAHLGALARLVNGDVALPDSVNDDAAAFERARVLAPSLRVLVDALRVAERVHDLSHVAVAAASPLEAAARGSASLRHDLSRLREALVADEDDSLADAQKLRDAILDELRPFASAPLQSAAHHVVVDATDDDDAAPENQENAQENATSSHSQKEENPFRQLKRATEALLVATPTSPGTTNDEQENNDTTSADFENQLAEFLDARARIRRGRQSLATLATLREKCRTSDLAKLAPAWARLIATAPVRGNDDAVLPRNARSVWAALAAAVAIERLFEAPLDYSSSTSNHHDGGTTPAPESGTTYGELLERRDVAMRTYVAAVAKKALKQRMSAATCAALVRLVSAVSAAASVSADSTRYARLREDLASAMNDCADAVPCWIMPCARVAQCLPAKVSFDLVVLDEASQSDASVLPVLLRGRACLIVGDHKQVSPTASFVAEKDIAELRQRLTHPYKEQLLPGRSIFDLAHVAMADARVALTQHFRCVPAVIAWSNAQFYHASLQPRKLPPAKDGTSLCPSVLSFRVRDGRKKGKTNDAEARAVTAYLKKELSSPGGKSSLVALRRKSVAVISLLGVEQARLIRRYALDELTDSQLARHRLVFGDPASFQGDERDLVVLSMVASPKEAPAQVGRLYEQRFNVAMSRAKERVVLFHSVALSDVPNADDLKHRLLAFFQRHRQPPRDAADDDEGSSSRGFVEARILEALDEFGFSYDRTDASIAGSLCVVRGSEDAQLCVCVDGGSLEEYASFLAEQRDLERSGWHFYRVWRQHWLVDPRAARDRLRHACLDVGCSSTDRSKRAIDEVVVVDSDDDDEVLAPPPQEEQQQQQEPQPQLRKKPAAATTSAKKKPATKRRRVVVVQETDDEDDMDEEDDS